MSIPRPPRPRVVVLGNQKSGTTAIAALLARHAGATATLDIPDVWRQPLERLRRPGALRWFAWRHHAEFSATIVKDPTLTFVYPQLRAALPGARFVLIARDPRANIRSILDRLALPGDHADLAPELRRRLPGAWQAVLDPATLAMTAGTYIDVLARRWNAAADVHLLHPDAVPLLRYEDFLADKAGWIARVAASLDLPHRGDVRDALGWQFQPGGERRNVPYATVFGAANLARVRSLCSERAARLGYELTAPVAAAS